MRVLVTGGGGFLGRYIVEQLAARGDTPRVLGRSEYPALAARGIECVRADLTDAAAVRAACAGQDAVIHVGALAGFWGPYSRYFETNVVGTRNVVAGCREHGVTRLVYTSSPSVVFAGGDMEGVDESVPYATEFESPYPRSKAQAEREALAASDEALAVCALRPHLIWGPRDNHILPRLVDRARSGRLRVIGDGTNKVSVTYVENGARAHLQALDALAPGSPLAGRAYFIGQAEPVVLWDFIDRLLACRGLGPVTGRVPVWLAAGVGGALEAGYRLLGIEREPPIARFVAHEMATSHWFDLGAARRDFGYDPEAIPTEEGLRRLRAAADPGRPGDPPAAG